MPKGKPEAEAYQINTPAQILFFGVVLTSFPAQVASAQIAPAQIAHTESPVIGV
jgi:hypothetical protein